MSDLTFRDFAGAIMEKNDARAAEVLQSLLGVDADAGSSAAAFFKTQMAADPSFMMKAMGMRTVVQEKDESGLVELIHGCFGLDTASAQTAAKAVLSRY